MPKRFTDSEKFRDPWYRKLKPVHKCLWEYFLSECDLAGIIEIDYESASFHIGQKVTEEDLLEFENRVILIAEGTFFIPKFIQFQQKELNIKQKAHEKIIFTLKKYGIPLKQLDQGDRYTLDTPQEGYQRCTSIGIGIGKGNSIGNSIVNLGTTRARKKNMENDIESCVELYNQTAKKHDLPLAQKITTPRKQKLKARLNDCGGVGGWIAALEKLAASSFCTGNNDRGWRADIDFLLQESSFIKLMEGKYDDRENTKRSDIEIARKSMAEALEKRRQREGNSS